MNTICEKLLGRLVLWHGTTRENAAAICKEGFRPARKSGHNLIRQATWFYHVTSFTEGENTDDSVGFIVAVDLDCYVRGRDYVHEMDDTIVFKLPLPPDLLLARLERPEFTGGSTLVEALGSQWQCDVVSEFAGCCCDTEIPWSQKSRIAEMLWSLAPDRYFGAEVPHYMLIAEVPGLNLAESARLVSLLREQAPGFLNGLLRLYHKTFLTPRLARATMVAAARFMEPARVLEFAEGSPSSNPPAQEDAAVAKFVDAILPRLPSDELVRGAIDMASMRHFPGTEDDIRTIGDWVAGRATEAEEAAFHYVMFAGDRYASHVARDLAIRILRETGKDYFERLLALTETDDLDTLSGATHTFADFREERAVPFLASRLKDDRKGPRAQAVRALGKIGTPDALAAIKSVINDKRKVVRNAVQQAFSNRN